MNFLAAHICSICEFDSWVKKIPWGRKWQPTPIFLPEKSHGQRSLEGYSPWGLKESDTSEQLNHNSRAREMGKAVRKHCNTVLQRPSTVPGMFLFLEGLRVGVCGPLRSPWVTLAAKSLQSCPTLCDPHRWQPIRLPHPWDSPGKNTGVGCHFLLQFMKEKSESEVAQWCLTLSNSMDCSLPGSSIRGFSRQEYWSGVPLPSLGIHKSPELSGKILGNTFFCGNR